MPPTYVTLGRQIAGQLTSSATVRRNLRTLSQSGLLPAAIWKRLPVAATFTVTLPDGETFRYLSMKREGIGRALHWRGIEGFEVETTRIFHALAKTAKTVVDIGANTGTFALIACAANPDALVYAFEPVPRVYERLVNNVALNGWQERCIVQNIAISNTEGILKIHIPYVEMPVSASLKADGFRAGDSYLADVTVKTLDSVCSGKQIDLIKMDVEGVEEQVLLGMREILQHSAPAIIAECYIEGPFRQIEAILAEYGYSFFHIGSGGPVKTPHIEPDPTGTYQNYLCVPERRMESILEL